MLPQLEAPFIFSYLFDFLFFISVRCSCAWGTTSLFYPDVIEWYGACVVIGIASRIDLTLDLVVPRSSTKAKANIGYVYEDSSQTLAGGNSGDSDSDDDSILSDIGETVTQVPSVYIKVAWGPVEDALEPHIEYHLQNLSWSVWRISSSKWLHAGAIENCHLWERGSLQREAWDCTVKAKKWFGKDQATQTVLIHMIKIVMNVQQATHMKHSYKQLNMAQSHEWWLTRACNNVACI